MHYNMSQQMSRHRHYNFHTYTFITFLFQNVLTLSEFRSSAARNLDLDKPHGVIISPSYSKVLLITNYSFISMLFQIRRQGRKGDPDPFADILKKANI